MKLKTLLSLHIGLTIIISNCNAQSPVLTADSINPVAGDYYAGYEDIISISPGSAGANQTWDISSISNNYVSTFTFVNASSTPYASNFPIANWARDNGTGGYEYFKTSLTAMQFYGGENPFSRSTYSVPEYDLRYPFTYGDSYIDTCIFTQIVNVDTSYFTMIETSTADGYGTLKTPSGTFNNSLRVHKYVIAKDSSQGVVKVDTTSIYNWYVNGIHHVVAGIDSGNAPTVYYNAIVTGISEQDNMVNAHRLFPNPTNDFLNIGSLSAHSKDAAIVSIMNILGETMHQEKVNLANEVRINVNELPDGIYFVRVTNANDSWVERFVKE